jgi:hypothetical protein
MVRQVLVLVSLLNPLASVTRRNRPPSTRPKGLNRVGCGCHINLLMKPAGCPTQTWALNVETKQKQPTLFRQDHFQSLTSFTLSSQRSGGPQRWLLLDSQYPKTKCSRTKAFMIRLRAPSPLYSIIQGPLLNCHSYTSHHRDPFNQTEAFLPRCSTSPVYRMTSRGYNPFMIRQGIS